jgi:hypothetical protein
MNETPQKCTLYTQYLLTGLFFVVITLILVGCNSGSIDSENSKDSKENRIATLDACTLLTGEEAEAILGKTVKKDSDFPMNIVLQDGKIITSKCSYSAVGFPWWLILNISYQRTASYPNTFEEYIKSKETVPGMPSQQIEVLKKNTTVQEIGDFAVWTADVPKSLTVFWKQYEIEILISFYEEDALESAKSVSRKVLEKL